MLNEHSISASDPDAQKTLLGYFRRDLFKTSFDYRRLSDEIRPTYAEPHAMAYQLATAFCRKAECPDRIGRIAIDYYADTEFNASAATIGDVHVIGVSAGVPVLLTALFFDLLKSTNPFAIDYTASNGDPEPGDFRFPIRMTTQKTPGSAAIARLIERTIRDSVPDLKWQRVWAVTLAEIAMMFVFAHELGHLVRGHTTAARKRDGQAIFEVTSSGMEQPRMLRRVRNLWEIEADETAFGFLWGYLITTAANRERFARRLRCRSAEHVQVALTARLIYAVSFVFFLLGQAQRRVDARNTHPSALVRITYLLAMAQTTLERFVPAASPEFLETEIQKAHSQAEAAWNRLGLEFGVGGYKETIDDLPVVINRIDRRRDSLTKVLRGFAWKPQSPPEP
jgi:hypothetical protein